MECALVGKLFSTMKSSGVADTAKRVDKAVPFKTETATEKIDVSNVEIELL